MKTFVPTIVNSDGSFTGGLANEFPIHDGVEPAFFSEGTWRIYHSHRNWEAARVATLAVGSVAALYLWARIMRRRDASQYDQGMTFVVAPASVFVAHELCESRSRRVMDRLIGQLHDSYRWESGPMTDALRGMGDDQQRPAVQAVRRAVVDLVGNEVTANALVTSLVCHKPSPRASGAPFTPDDLQAWLSPAEG